MTENVQPTGWATEIPKDRPLRIVFMGTPEFAVPTLQALLQSPHQIVSVFTQPDRKQGRGQKTHPPPVKEVALAANIPVRQPEKLATAEWFQQFQEDKPDLAVVIAYGKILRPRFLCVPPLGCINCHASLLPYYRGAAPIYWAMANGEVETGITTMWMDAGMDTGPELLRRAIPIGPEETGGSLHDRLSQLAATLLIETIDQLVAGTLSIVPQPETGATHAPMLDKDENWIDFARPSHVVHNHIRALDPFPGARALLPNGDPIKFFGSQEVPEQHGPAGKILEASAQGLLVACQTGAIRLQELQLAGRKRLHITQFLKGHTFTEPTFLSHPKNAPTE